MKNNSQSVTLLVTRWEISPPRAAAPTPLLPEFVPSMSGGFQRQAKEAKANFQPIIYIFYLPENALNCVFCHKGWIFSLRFLRLGMFHPSNRRVRGEGWLKFAFACVPKCLRFLRLLASWTEGLSIDLPSLPSPAFALPSPQDALQRGSEAKQMKHADSIRGEAGASSAG
jgi:hypothetical protein